MLDGINHVTLAVSDLDISFDFYVSTLGMKPEVKWNTGAYLSVGNLWFCLSLDTVSKSSDYSHVAFNIKADKFDEFQSRLNANNVTLWKENTSQGKSIYLLDPDEHKLEIHSGNLQDRLEDLKSNLYQGLEWY